MKKRRLINLFLTSVMLLSSVLTPQMAHVVASTVNGENAEDTEQVNENDMPDVDAEDNVKEDDNTKAGDGGEEITDVTAEGETAEDEIEVITTDEADTGEPEKDGKETRGSPKVENVDESEADEEIVEDEAEETEDEELEEVDSFSTDIKLLREISDDEIIFSNISFTDLEGNEFTADNPYDLEGAETGNLYLKWALPEGHQVTGGDTYTFNLPPQFTPVSATNGTLGGVGTWTVNAAGVVTFTFNDQVDGDEVAGDFAFEIRLVEKELEDTIEQEIAFPIGPEEHFINFNVQPKGGSLIDKSGTINNEGYNSTAAEWTVDINTSLETLVNASITDDIPENMTFREGSVEVFSLGISLFGERTEGSAIDASKYTVIPDDNGNPVISFIGLTEEEANQAYRIKYTTDIVEPADGFNGTQTFINNAVLTNDGDTSSSSGTVSSGYGRAIEKGDPKYDSGSQTFDWTIDYNFNQKYIDVDEATIKDTWSPAGSMALDTLNVYPVTISSDGTSTVSATPIPSNQYTMTPKDDNSGFDLSFNNDIDGQAYQIRYTTNILGEQGTGIVDGGGNVTNSVQTGTEMSDGSSGSWGQQGIIKRHVKTDVGAKTIDWTIRLNQNGYQMDNLVLEDTFIGDGLTLIENTENYSDYELTIIDSNDKEFTAYEITYREPTVDNPGGFTLTFTETINEPLTLTYKTHFERNSDGSASYGNNASIGWSKGDNKYSSETGDITVTPEGHTAKNGVKTGSYNATNKQITWTVNTNYARLPIESSYTIADSIPENQVLLEDTLEVYSYEVGSRGQIIDENTLDEGSYTVDYPNEANEQTLTVTLGDTHMGEHTAVGIRFNTEFANEWVRDGEVENTALVTNGSTPFKLDAKVEIPYGGEYARKTGNQAGDFNERVDWSIVLNPNQTRIRNYTLTDNPDLNSVLMEDTFVVYEASVNAEGNVSRTDTVLEVGKDYTLNITIDGETGEQQFVLQFSDEITQAYILEYSSFIDPLAPQGAQISNSYVVAGDNVDTIETDEVSSSVTKVNAGSGDGSSIRGGLTIEKSDENGESLAGATFELYTKDGSQLLRSGTTNTEGELTFGGLRRGTYLLREVEAPNRYVISDELAEGVEVTLNHENDGEFTFDTRTNSLSEITINKVDENDNPILDSATFNIENVAGTVVRQNVKTEEGTVVVEDLDPGDYYLVEQSAPTGYIRNAARIPFTVEILENGTQPNTIVKVTNYKGTAEFIKTDSNGNPLANAQFRVETINGQQIGELVTSDAEGVIRVENLAPGSYELVETQAPSGYIHNLESIGFTIPASVQGEPETFEFGNFKNYQGIVQLAKTNESQDPLEEAVFEVRDAEGNPVGEPHTTDENGRILVTGLAPGEYTFHEISAPAGYVIDTTPIPFEITSRATGAPARVTVGDTINYQGSVLLEKLDAEGNALDGAVFTLYEVLEDGERVLIDSYTSENNGLVEVNNLAPGNYVFVETEAPAGYVLNTDEVFFEIAAEAAGRPVRVETDSAINYKGSVALQKTDVDENPLEGARFNIEDTEGNVIQRDLDSDADGLVFAEGLAPGSYFFVETAAPTGYIINETPIPFEIEQEASGLPETVDAGRAINYQGSVEWQKVNTTGEGLSDAEFSILDENGGIVVEGLTSDDDGNFSYDGLVPGEYTIVETVASEGYLLNSETVKFTVPESAPEVVTVKMEDFVNYQGSAQMLKVNEAEEFLQGATFEVRDAEDNFVIELTSDENGRVIVENLAPGDYTFVETASPDGYITNTEPAEFTIPAEFEGEPEVVNAGDFTNYKGSVVLEKTDVDETPLADAVFEIRDLENTLIRSNIISDENGLVEVDELAPGTYRFIELTAPEGYLINETIIEFTIESEAAGEPEVVEADSLINYQGSVVLEKMNADDESLEGAVFEIRDLENNVIQRNLTSDENGLVEAVDLAPGDYVFVETKAPEGYLINETPIPFTIDDSAYGEPEVVDAEIAVNYQGSVQWLKVDSNDGVLPGAQFNVLDEEGTVVTENVGTNENGLVEVDGLAPGTYTIQETMAVDGYLLNLAEVEFTIADRAEGRPEVVIADNFVNYQGSAQMLKVNAAGEVLEGAVFEVLDADGAIVDTVISNENGRVFVENLAPGNYLFVEISSPDGYITNTEPVEFTIANQAENEPEVVNAGDFTNYKGSVVLEKTAVDGTPLADAEFEIRDSENHLIRSNILSDENGLVEVEGLAPGTYRFIEVTAPENYLINETPIEFTIEAEAAGEPEVVEADSLINYKGSVRLEKTDENGTPLSDAVFEIRDLDGNVVQSNLVSNDLGQVEADDLAPGDYFFFETQAPDGYLINETPIPFTIADSALGEPAVVEAGQAVNYQGSADWLKVDENGQILEGAQFNVLDEEGSIVAEDLISDENGRVTVDGLAPGTYTIVETEAVDGYILNTELGGFDIPTSAEGRPETETADNFVNYQGKVLLTKTDVDGNPLEGAVFTLNRDGETIEENLATNELGQIMVEGLAPGDYIFTEVSAPEGFIVDTTPLTFSIEAENEGEPVLITIGDIINYQGEASVNKVDIDGNPLSGAVFELRDAAGNRLRDDLVSDEKGRVAVDNLAPGDYVLKEINAPLGYILNTTSISFTIEGSSDGEPELVSLGELVNYQGSVELTKTDEDGNLLEGAEFSLLDGEGNELQTNLISNADGKVRINNLAPGKYTIVETKAPEGYILSEQTYTFNIHPAAEGEPEVVLITITNTEDSTGELPETPGSEEPGDPDDPTDPEDPEDEDLPTTGEAVTYSLLAATLIAVGGLLVLYDRKRSSEANKK